MRYQAQCLCCGSGFESNSSDDFRRMLESHVAGDKAHDLVLTDKQYSGEPIHISCASVEGEIKERCQNN